MASKFDIGAEVVKVGALVWFLFVAFSDAALPDAIWTPVSALLKAGIVVVAYMAGRHFAKTYQEGWRNYLLAFYAAGVLALVIWARFGTHVEDADPIYGGGETVVDFAPTVAQRSNRAFTIFVTLLIPALWGMYKERKAS